MFVSNMIQQVFKVNISSPKYDSKYIIYSNLSVNPYICLFIVIHDANRKIISQQHFNVTKLGIWTQDTFLRWRKNVDSL